MYKSSLSAKLQFTLNVFSCQFCKIVLFNNKFHCLVSDICLIIMQIHYIFITYDQRDHLSHLHYTPAINVPIFHWSFGHNESNNMRHLIILLSVMAINTSFEELWTWPKTVLFQKKSVPFSQDKHRPRLMGQKEIHFFGPDKKV